MGFWESLIGLSKTILKKVLGKALVALALLQTVIVEIAAFFNERPWTYVYADVRYPEPLTLSHFLCGQCITSMPHKITDDKISNPTFGAPPSRKWPSVKVN